MNIGSMILSITQLGADKRPFLDALELTAAAGYDHVSLLSVPGGPRLQRGTRPPCTFIDVFQSDWAVLREQLNRVGLKLTHVHAGGLNLSTDDSTAKSIDALESNAILAHNLGCTVLGFGVGPALAIGTPWEEKRPYLDRAAHAFRTLGDRLQRLPIKLGVDIHFRAPIETVRDASYVLDQSEQRQVGLCLNMGHLATAGEPGWELVTAYPDAIAVAAYKDHRKPDPGVDHPFASVRLGAGETPLERYVQAFKAVGVTPYQVISIEHEPWEQKQTAMRESLSYLKQLWAKLD